MAISSASQPVFDPTNFKKGQPIDNPFLPWIPGTTFLYDTYLPGKVLEQIDTVRVTHHTKQIDGVTCTAVSDNVTDPQTGQFIEKTTDYYAQDKSGNVWYFGEKSAEYDNGKLVTTEGSWLAGVKGAHPGIIQEANPHIGDSYDEEFAPDVARDHGEVIGLNGAATVPAGHFDHLLVTRETSVLEPGAPETKYYAAEVGEVFGKEQLTGETDRLVFISSTTAIKLMATNNIKHIRDFDIGTDKFGLSPALFPEIGGNLSNGEFLVGKQAHDRNDHLIYNADNGRLFYDVDGKGGDAKELIAVLHKHLDLHASDFLVVS
jgi:hypothetical protein